MRIKAKSKELKLAIAKMASLPGREMGAAGNSILTIEADEFGGLRLRRATSYAHVRITCEADIEEPGRAVLPYGPLAKALENCEGGEITLETGFEPARELLVSSGENDEASVMFLPESDVIPPPPPLRGVELVLSHDELIKTLRIAGAASSTDRSRPHLMGVCFRKVPGALSVFGCNGHRAHVCRIAALVERINPEEDGERDIGILLPNEGVECAKKVFADADGRCVLTLGPSGVQIDAGEVSLRLPVSETITPFIDPMLNPRAEVNFEIERGPLLKAIKAIAPTCVDSGGDSSVVFAVSKEGVTLSASNNAARVKRIVPCKSDGAGEWTIESKYFAQLLECAELDKLHLLIAAHGQQLYYREGERDFLVMFRALNVKRGEKPVPLAKQK